MQITQLPDGAGVFIDTNIVVLAGAAGSFGAQGAGLRVAQ